MNIRNFFISIATLSLVVFANADSTAAQAASSGILTNISDVLGIIVSLFAVLTILGTIGKKIFAESELEKRIKQTEAEIIQLKNQLTVNHDEMKSMFDSLRNDLAEKAPKNKFEQLNIDHSELEETVTNGIDKLNGTIKELAIVELKLNDMKNNFDEKNTDRKHEINEINETIKSLRETVREEVNSVKDIMMKIMMKLHE